VNESNIVVVVVVVAIYYYLYCFLIMLCHYNTFYTILSPIALVRNDLTGTIPSEIGLMTSLEWLNLGK